jgi:hypothetical protein
VPAFSGARSGYSSDHVTRPQGLYKGGTRLSNRAEVLLNERYPMSIVGITQLDAEVGSCTTEAASSQTNIE